MDKSTLRQYAKNLRRQSTDTEHHLWYYLRANRLGFKFKRQVPIGSYIVDFVCFEKHLVIELDGGQHLNNQLYDKKRSDWLKAHGFKILRFWNNQMLMETEGVMETIYRAVVEEVPLPQAGEGLG